MQATPIFVSSINRALEHTWAAIQRRHPDVPHAVVTLATNAGKFTRAGQAGAITGGHWAEARWMVPGEGKRGEVVIAGEVLECDAAELLAILLHEAAHGVATARKIKDTSNRHRYHNKRFRVLAVELGLECGHHDTLGWQNTSLTPATRELFAEQIAALDSAQEAARRTFRVAPLLRTVGRGSKDEAGADDEAGVDDDADDEAGVKATRVKLICACGRCCYVAHGTAAQAPIFCGEDACGTQFVLADGRSPVQRHKEGSR